MDVDRSQPDMNSRRLDDWKDLFEPEDTRWRQYQESEKSEFQS